MNSQELLDYINRLSEENPLIESEEASQIQDAYEELCQKVSWLDAGNVGSSFSHTDTAFPEAGSLDTQTESLSAFICDQLDRQRLPKPLLALTKYMAELLDEDGWLAQEDLDALADLKIPETLTREALKVLQSLEPAGVGARSLSECLLLQLERQGECSDFLRTLISQFLPELGKKHYGPIRQQLGVTTEEILEAEQIISSLNPRPGQVFQTSEPVTYIRPDLFVVELDGTLQVLLNEYYLPRISINDYYVRLLQTNPEKETVVYLRQKLQQARGLLTGLERRNSTLQRCAEAILAVQHDFFSQKALTPAPMTLAVLAEMLSLHPSTVSRATKGKYLQCRQGTFPLRYFFSRPVGQPDYSSHRIGQRIAELIRDENPQKPLSDQKICDLLAKEGTQIARRTVAKYRTEYRIPSSTVRKHTQTLNV